VTRRARFRGPKPDRRRALELLAGSPQEGCSEAIMRAHGFSVEQLVELVRAGLATAKAQRVGAGARKIEVATLRITEAGRRALEGGKP
jgi:hypothetical protein